ncbi:LamG domain-containing protein [Patescibacteria group bacterium]
MINKKTNKYLLFIGIFIVFVVLPLASQSQVDLPGGDILLKEYLFPISSYIEVGAPVYQSAVQCVGSKLYDGTYEEVSYTDCDNLAAFDEVDPIRQWSDSAAVFSSETAQFSYRFTVEDQERYVFKVNVTNDQDDFDDLTREQIDFIFADYASGNYVNNTNSYQIDSPNGNLTILEYSVDNGVIAFDSNQKYDLFRSMVFSVAVGSFDDGGVETIEQKGYMIVPNNGSAEISEGEVVVGVLDVGEHVIYLNFLTDFYYDFSASLGDVPSYFNEFSNADLNGDNILDVNPVIHSVGIDAIKPADDIVGLRIYSDQENIAPRTWYQENVINASTGIEDILVDGYRAVRDDRTVYVHAANLSENRVCLTGPNEGQICEPANADAICGAGETCGIRRFFYTNIYVIAYNQSAQPSTINIFNQMFDNWVFNKNIIADDPINAEVNKDKLRRDTIRKADLSQMERLIKAYHNDNGKYPELSAGTLVRNHSISTWSSWQSTLANQLGTALPVDPLNLMVTEYRGPYNCTDPLEAASCQSFCEQDFYGCPADRQCFNNAYCSICPLGYDAVSCWDDVNSLFAYDIHGKTCDPATGAGCCDPSIQGSLNLGGTECNFDGAYVYQYTALENGQAYLLNYRFEFTDVATCDPGQCAFGNKCYQPGSCLASCDDNGENCGSCDNPSYDNETDCVANSSNWTSFEQYRNLYCYLGTWRTACGDGFVQNQCGETCDYNAVITDEESWCDVNYGQADWYNERNIGSTCTSTCEVLVGGVDYEPPRYTQDLADIDCGGYCGDFITQNIYDEQCDLGPDAAALPTRENLGSAGVSQASQYMCSGTSGGDPEVKNGNICDQYKLYWEPSYADCALLATYPDAAYHVFNFETDYIMAEDNAAIKYDFNVSESGNYVFKLKTASYGEDLSQLTDDQIDYLLGLAQIDIPENTMMGIVTPDRDLQIPDMGLIEDTQEKNRLMRNLVFSVYVDSEAETNKKGFISVPAVTHGTRVEEGSVSLGQLSAGPHTIYIHYISDWAIDLSWPALNVISGYFDNFTGTWLDKNAVIYEVSLFSPDLGVANCQSFGGFCGDGTIQTEYGEQCDIKNYDSPTPPETTNLFKNPSFEGFISPWQVTLGNAELDETNSLHGQRSLRLDIDPSLVGGFYKAQLLMAQPNAPAIQIGGENLYRTENYVKLLNGQLEKITLQTADDYTLSNWTAELDLNEDAPGADAWVRFWADIGINDGKAMRLTFYSTDPATVVAVDNLQFRAWGAHRQQYDCLNNSLSGKLCEYSGGYCGDGITQAAWGESCDSREGMPCVAPADCGGGSSCVGGICQGSADCNKFCTQSFCGDGLIQAPNAEGVNEICDWASDPDCSRDCQHIKMGGNCDAGRPCDSNLSCTIRNFGDTETKCLGARGSYGCNTNNDCILGYYCNITSSKCEPEISTYLKYHPEGTDPVALPSPPSPPGLSYDINITTCPYLVLTSGKEGFEVLVDRCTGIHWEAADNITQTDWTYADATASGCIGVNRLPNILELYSLVRQTNQGLFYSDKEALRLCPVSCQYAPNEEDLCSDCVDDNYIYWSSTCSKTDGTTCTHALAVNFKYGSIEEYPVIDLPETTHNDLTKFKVHCTKSAECLNGVIEPGESCEFIIDEFDNIIEKNINAQCSEFGYDGGFVHCDPETCNYKFENCYFNSAVNKSCEDVCNEKIDVGCRTVGLDIDELSDFYDIAGRIFAYAEDGRMMDIAGDNSCDVTDIPEADNCAYLFQNKNERCVDTVSGLTAPFNSQFSYCNCHEPSFFELVYTGGGECTTGNIRACGSDIGECTAGVETCIAGFWEGVCIGETTPGTEVCDAGLLDENCDGWQNEGCDCADGATQQCGVTDEGACAYGIETCVAGVWGACVGNIDPQGGEICEGSVDEDCDGSVDETCFCTNGAVRSCGSNVGACSEGVEDCVVGNWDGVCDGEVTAGTEVCDGSTDEDCDGSVDEGCYGFLTDLYAYWPLDRNANDHSGNGFHGTETATSYIAGLFGEAASFSNTHNTDHISMEGYDTQFRMGKNDFSYSVWIYYDGSAQFASIVGKVDAGNLKQYAIFIVNDSVTSNPGKKLGALTRPDSSSASQRYILNSVDLSIGWHHVVLVEDYSANLKLYLDGNLIGTDNNSHASKDNDVPGRTFQIGAGHDLATADFNGSVDEVSFYTKALSATEVGVMYGNWADIKATIIP